MKKVDKQQAQADIDKLCEKEKTMRKPKKYDTSDLSRHCAQILSWALSERASKRKVARLVKEKLSISRSPDAIYRFVKKHNDGHWTHPRSLKKGTQK